MDTPEELKRLRGEIERIDREMIRLIRERVELAREVGKTKRQHDLPILDPAREAAIVRRAGELAREAGLDLDVDLNAMRHDLDAELGHRLVLVLEVGVVLPVLLLELRRALGDQAVLLGDRFLIANVTCTNCTVRGCSPR